MQHKSLSRTRRASVLGFTAAALVVSMTGSAFACTFFYGKLTVSSTDPETGLRSSAFTDGGGSPSSDPLKDGAFHGTCPVPAPVDNLTNSDVSASRPAQGLYKADLLTVQVGATTTCVTQNSLADQPGTDGDYDVRWLNLKVATTSRSCLSPDNDSKVQILGSINIVSGAAGPTTFPQGLAEAGDQVNACVNKPNAGPEDFSPPEVKLLML